MTQTEHDTRQNGTKQQGNETNHANEHALTTNTLTIATPRSALTVSNERSCITRHTRHIPRPPPLAHTHQRHTRSHRQNTKRAKMGTKYMNISESCSRAGRAYAAIHSNIPTDTTNGATTPRQRRRRPRTTKHHVHPPSRLVNRPNTRLTRTHTHTRTQITPVDNKSRRECRAFLPPQRTASTRSSRRTGQQQI